ncbi:toll/interleukin-1 receptor domain-containing protein [Parerythrobacter aestuarii]|uniref:toll/interleukin-1 receptor domain-containing protein n=1 Tax=Parerythrobacter aestuarii TaxID=3020909 RepID=UPI0024DE2FA6|nr:toll/interleukin-1 receptor domain-containing protein [Parerythrobacter aestuarii]
MEDETGDENVAPQFSAFVSYSHADAAIVRRLHSQLESYRLPKGLGEVATLNAERGKLGRVFRDREDFSAAENLSDAVCAALDRSQVLVVVCSPDAKQSKWVGQEIAYFRAHRPGMPILAALVRGEPSEAFPAALTESGAEPLAADLRKEGDGWKLGFLKIVAGIAGVPLDALVQRDSQRQTRRVMAVTGMVAALALIMAGMTIIALQARNEAQAQRAEAEGLVEYMITDLREDLQGVTSLSVMGRVNKRALEYYAKQDLSTLAAESLERRAFLLHAMGEDDEKAGKLDDALAKFEEAFRTTEALLDRDPGNPDRIFGHAQSQYWAGYIAYLQKNWTKASQYWSGYKRHSEQLIEGGSANFQWVMEAGYAAGNLCTLELDRKGSLELAERECQEAIGRFEEACKIKPGQRSCIEAQANRYAWLADVSGRRGDFGKALATRLKGEALIEGLRASDPDNLDLTDLWVAAQIAIARTERSLGRGQAASRRLQRARQEMLRLIAIDPDNASWRSKLEMIDETGGGNE